jgi:5'-methylthioadenosine phosphorylase
MWGIIGGSGFGKFDEFEVLQELPRETPFGLASSGLQRVKIGEHEVIFLARHGKTHENLPSEVNYRANIFAMKQLGVSGILAFSAVGSLRKELSPGDMVVPTQYIDRTKGVRAHTFCGEGMVGHVSLATPVCTEVADKVIGFVSDPTWGRHSQKTYVCIEGPTFSTKAESHMYRQFGADIIGMTNFPEFALAREAGINYLPMCFVTDYDCWNEEHADVTLDEVIQIMQGNNVKGFAMAQAILAQAARPEILWTGKNQAAETGLKIGLMTPKGAIPTEKMVWLETLLS